MSNSLELDRKARLVISRIWASAGALRDPAANAVSINADGILVGQNEVIMADNNLERWVTFDLHIYRATTFTDDPEVEPPAINSEGRILGCHLHRHHAQ